MMKPDRVCHDCAVFLVVAWAAVDRSHPGESTGDVYNDYLEDLHELSELEAAMLENGCVHFNQKRGVSEPR